MKNFLMIVLFSLSVSFHYYALADICPYIEQFEPEIPPAGWTLLVSPTFPGPKDRYQFVNATHSLNTTYYNLQVLCRYECVENKASCSPFTLLSNGLYKWPIANKAPWNSSQVMTSTIVCMPPDNNPIQCIFSNIPRDNVAHLNSSWKVLLPQEIFSLG